MRSITTAAQITSGWASMPAIISRLAVAMSVSARASWGLLAKATLPGSEMFIPLSRLAEQFMSIRTTRSARSLPRGGSKRRLNRWTKPVRQSLHSNRSAFGIKKK